MVFKPNAPYKLEEYGVSALAWYVTLMSISADKVRWLFTHLVFVKHAGMSKLCVFLIYCIVGINTTIGLILLLSVIVLQLLLSASLIYQNIRQNSRISSFENIMKAGGCGILIFDAAERLQYSNQVAQGYLTALDGNRPFEQLSAFISYMFDHAIDDAHYSMRFGEQPDFLEVVADRFGASYLVEMHKQKDQSTGVIFRNISCVRKRDQDFLALLKDKEVEISRSQKLDSLGRLSAGIAHDFNNILSIIEGYARMLGMNAENPERVSEYAQKITEASVRGSGLTKKMMAFARHKVKRDQITDLKILIEDQRTLLLPLIGESIDFKVKLGAGHLCVCCDPDSFTQILMNLVVNAVDAIRDFGRIEVSVYEIGEDALPAFVRERGKPYVCLVVRDTGRGMGKEVCERIFDPFYTTKEQGQGTGLGLSVTYGLVKDMGGYIDVRSELSVGTEFSIYIPQSDALPVDVPRKIQLAEDGTMDFSGLTALVVEDEPDLRVILSEILQRYNMNVIGAENADEALVLQDDYAGDIDVLITDLVMPGINGLKLADLVKSLRPDIQTVFMSGYPARGDAAKITIPDDALFMPKPLNYDELCLCLFKSLRTDQSNIVPINLERVGDI